MTRILLFLFLLAVPPAFAVHERVESPASITLSFGVDARAEIRFIAGHVDDVTIWFGGQAHSVPRETCRKLRDLRTESMRLRWDGKFKTPQESPYFYLRVPFGLEQERRFGDLPEIELMFRDGRFVEGNIIRKVSQDEWIYSAL